MRAFIAVDLPGKVRTRLGATLECLRSTGVRASWVKPENLHITMKFLGDVDEAMVPDLQRRLDRVGLATEAYATRLCGYGFFPSRRRPRILYVATDQERLFGNIVERLDRLLAPAGFMPERNFVSHVTLARIKGPQHVPRLRAELEKLDFREGFEVDGISLYRSILQPSGVRYERLHHSRFRA